MGKIENRFDAHNTKCILDLIQLGFVINPEQPIYLLAVPI